MSQVDADRNLLFAVIALNDDLIDQTQFADVCAGWAVRMSEPLANLLIERGWIRLWDAVTTQPLGEPMSQRGPVRHLVFRGDGKALLTGSTDGTARIWDATTGAPFGAPMSHGGAVTAVAFSRDGRSVVTGSEDRTARVWDAATGRPSGKPLPHPAAVLSVAFSPDGTLILTGGDDRAVRIWNAASRELRGDPLSTDYPVRSVVIDPAKEHLLTSPDSLADRFGRSQLWNLTTRKGSALSDDIVDSYRGLMAFSPDGKRLLVEARDPFSRQSEAWLVDVVSRRPIGVPMRLPDLSNALFSPDGKRLLTTASDSEEEHSEVRFWDASTGLPIGPPVSIRDEVATAAFSSDGTRAVTGSPRSVRMHKRSPWHTTALAGTPTLSSRWSGRLASTVPMGTPGTGC